MTLSGIEERFSLVTIDKEVFINKFSEDVKIGLTSESKYLPFVYFYDHIGSQLFEQICELPEYYLTRTETDILATNADGIASQFAEETVLVELGSGSSTKTRILIEAFLDRQNLAHYTPIDVSHKMLEESSYSLLEAYPDLEINAIAARYNEGIDHLNIQTDQQNLITWLGSSIGNFDRSEVTTFLRHIQEIMLPNDRFLVGIDLQKDKTIIEKAYNDKQGITAEFNLNLLTHVNRELGGDFVLENFEHKAIYNEEIGRIEMYLISNIHQKAFISELDLEVSFTANETIHTENSFKYSLDDINTLAEETGLYVEQQWFDAEQLFSLNLFAPAVD
ncbi:MAG: L-histidine N(alpha)-methyltransferase [Candidatus Brocadiales bacterium]|nr:L-histidine N(alpha)-methyltransferase [Candidatus Brocadiales bacterium]